MRHVSGLRAIGSVAGASTTGPATMPLNNNFVACSPHVVGARDGGDTEEEVDHHVRR